MKKLQQISMAAVLTLMLATGVFAGIIETPATPPPPPPPDALSATSSGDIATGGLQNPQAMSDSVADIALNLLHTMMSVF